MRGDGWQRVDLTGLSISDTGANSLLCSSLQRCGLATDAEVELPLRARLDWSRVDGTSAAGLAFFSTVVRELVSREHSYATIDPSDKRLARLTDENGTNLAISGERVPTRHTVKNIACLFYSTSRKSHPGIALQPSLISAIFGKDIIRQRFELSPQLKRRKPLLGDRLLS